MVRQTASTTIVTANAKIQAKQYHDTVRCKIKGSILLALCASATLKCDSTAHVPNRHHQQFQDEPKDLFAIPPLAVQLILEATVFNELHVCDFEGTSGGALRLRIREFAQAKKSNYKSGFCSV